MYYDNPTQYYLPSGESTFSEFEPHKLWGKEKTRPKDTKPVDAPEPAPVADEALQVTTCTHYHAGPRCPYCGPGGEGEDPSAHIWLPPQGAALQLGAWAHDVDLTSQAEDIASDMAHLTLDGDMGLAEPSEGAWDESCEHQHADSEYLGTSAYGQVLAHQDSDSEYYGPPAYEEPSASGSYQDQSPTKGKGKAKHHKKKSK